MIEAHAFEGKTIAVFGLGRSGITAALSLQKGGANVLAWDDNEQVRKQAKKEGVNLADIKQADWSVIDELVLSPGVPHKLPKPHWSAELANKAGVPIICDIEIFAREVMARAPERRPNIIAITGTNGKSTTTALIGHILSECGRDSQVGGNIGRGVLDLEDIFPCANYVLELSSYQLERTHSLKPNAAVFLNLSPDHLDRHGNMESYKQAKLRIFNNQDKNDTAIIGVDDRDTKAIFSQMLAKNGKRILSISGRRSLGRGVSVIKGKLYSVMDGQCQMVADLANAKGLDGVHNWQNAAAAFAACRAIGLDAQEIGRAILSFTGLKHRLQTIGSAGHVRFVNDSKATNTNATAKALDTFKNIYWIVGGQAKQGGIEELSPYFSNIKKAYLIGEASRGFHKTLSKHNVEHKISGELYMAVLCATKDALASKNGEAVVLLSPACASFDQFASFEHRGDVFINQAKKIIAMFDREKQNLQKGVA